MLGNFWFKKEKPLLGLTGMGGGVGSSLVGGAGGGSFTIKKYDTSNSLQSTTPYTVVAPGTIFRYADAGYYTLEMEASSSDIQFQMWAWGGGGGTTGPGSGAPGFGGAGGGVRGTATFSAGDTITFLVGGGGGFSGSTNNIASAFPDGGNTPPSDGYAEGPGGGRSSVYDGLLPYANRDASPNTFLLIGGAGGGGSTHSSGGTQKAMGGYPSGYNGGGYYPTEGPTVQGSGGTQSAGGAGGAAGRAPAGSAGGKYVGGDANGGGGGGGYYGGGGAGGFYAMGGGGSGYIHPSLSSTASFNALPGHPAHKEAKDDPANPGIKPASAASSGYAAPPGPGWSEPNGGMDGAVIFKVL